MSGRISNGTTEAASLASQVRLIILVELDFPSGVVCAHSGVGDFVWNGQTFRGVGTLGKVSEIEEGEELSAYGFKLELSGVAPDVVAISLADTYQGRPARMWIQFLNEQYQPEGDPVGPFAGLMDTMDGAIGRSGVISLSVESRMREWNRPRVRRFTHQDQQSEYPDDFGFEFVSATTEKEITWGFA